MKNKFLKTTSVCLVMAMTLTGCTNPITAVKDKLSNKSEEPSTEDLSYIESSLILTDKVDWASGETFSVDAIVQSTDTEKEVDVMKFVDSNGNQQDSFTCSETGTFSMSVCVWYVDGSMDSETYVFNVVDGSESESSESIQEVSLPREWEQKISDGSYLLDTFKTENGDIISYLKPNVMAVNSAVDSLKKELFYNESSSLSYSLVYASEYKNSTQEMVSGVIEQADLYASMTEDDYKFKVESGEIEVSDGDTYESTKASYQQIADAFRNVFVVESSGISVGNFNITIDNNYTDYSGIVEGAKRVYTGSSAYLTLPNGGVLELDVYPIQEGNAGLPVDISEYKGEKLQVEESSLEDYNNMADSFSSLDSAAKSVIADVFAYVSLEDYSNYISSTPVTTESQEQVEETEVQSTSTQPEVTNTSNVSTERVETYKEKYPQLFTWPDQQAIYGMNPKKLVYDLLSVTDESGATTYEDCLIPIWGVNEHRFLNDMDFDSGSNNRANASTTVNPSQSSAGSGLFGNTTQSNNQSGNSNTESSNEETTTATLSTSFGDFEVTSTSSLIIDEGKSSKSQVSIKDGNGVYYRIISSTAASIEKAKAKPMYDIDGMDENSWQCIKGASETVPMGTITRYYVIYNTSDGEAHTAEYMYVIASGSGYLMIMPDSALTTTSSTMYNICKMIKEK